MFKHQIEAAVAEGKKVHRLGWPKGDYVVSGGKLTAFELSDDEAKSMGLKNGATAEVYPDALVYISEGKANIGYTLTHDDKISGDWEVLAK